MFRAEIRWSKDYGGWFIYNGRYWEKDANNNIKKFAIKLHDKLLEELDAFIGSDEALANFSRHVKNSGANGKLEAMLDCAKAFLGAEQGTFDQRDNLLNLSNKTLNLTPNEKNGTIGSQPFNPDDLITKICDVEYDGKAGCPRWIKFLDEIFLEQQSIIDFMQRVIGYCLTASTKEQCLFILYGCGRNGKSIFINTITKMLGHYAVNCPQNALIKKSHTGGISNDIASLKGARFVTATESNQNVTLDEALIKQLTGGDKVTARFLHREFFQFNPTFKIFISTNHKPNIRGTDFGIWRRIKMVPFDLVVEEGDDDRTLDKKLEKELPGILVWAVRGYKEWLKKGLQTPKEVYEATANYQDEEDDLGQFLKEYCVVDPKGELPVLLFKQKFKDAHGYFKGHKLINEYMHKNGVKEGRTYVNGVQVRCWKGLRFPGLFDSQGSI